MQSLTFRGLCQQVRQKRATIVDADGRRATHDG
jgi:hypothetical protein